MNIYLPDAPRDETSLTSRRLRFLLYCHDTFGLGHIRRTLSLAAQFTFALPNAEVLIVTGSPVAHAFLLPPRTDFVKLPVVTKRSDGTYAARDLSMDFAAIRNLRAAILREVAQGYRPDVFLVDHAPHGLKGEAVPTLVMLQSMFPDCLRVLGLRDIIDAAPIIRQNWTREGIYHTLEHGYDRILVYGSRQMYDVADEYGLSQAAAQKVAYCGYLDRVSTPDAGESMDEAAMSISNELEIAVDASRPLVAVTAGGGGDGFPLMQAYLRGLRHIPDVPFSSVLLAGPLMPADELQRLRDLASMLTAGSVQIETFLPDPLPLLRRADLVVAMAGYNTSCELLALRSRALLVPRAAPRQEQLIRASLLARHGLVSMLHPDDATPVRLLDAVLNALVQHRPVASRMAAAGIAFHGQQTATRIIVEDVLHRLSYRASEQLEVAHV